MTQHSSHPQRDACSSRGADSLTRVAATTCGERTGSPGTSNCGIQPPTTIISITWIHARSGQPLAVTLNGTVRGLPYKQEAGGSSPSPPIIKRPAKQPLRRFGASALRVSYSVGVATPNRCREQATRHSASTSMPERVGGAVVAYPEGTVNRVLQLSDGSYAVHGIATPAPQHLRQPGLEGHRGRVGRRTARGRMPGAPALWARPRVVPEPLSPATDPRLVTDG
jgi:hypothetical protein